MSEVKKRDIDPEDVLNDAKEVFGFDVSTILKDLMDAQKNLELKSRIESPLALTRLFLYEKAHRKAGDKESADLVKYFRKYYLRSCIGLNGLARTEIKEIFQGIYQTLKTRLSLSESLTRPLD